jgi:hypothetical protein
MCASIILSSQGVWGRMTSDPDEKKLWGGGDHIEFLAIPLELHFREAEGVELFRIF